MYRAFAVNSMFSSLQISFADALLRAPILVNNREPIRSYLAGFAEVSAADYTECPLNVRVKLNSPSL